ncbi:hypothetical protein CDAR_282051 [Caerostris darwini]|uniref:Uncharacterized protein n=1 Tax=Caerostris darwini TaxID=1538125 RepID=A0AAV4WQN0_9ARAC|nr:hypothetical protein CDAR_282051 [Caerostris darwini]
MLSPRALSRHQYPFPQTFYDRAHCVTPVNREYCLVDPVLPKCLGNSGWRSFTDDIWIPEPARVFLKDYFPTEDLTGLN